MIVGGDEFLEPDLTCCGGSRRNFHACVVEVEEGCLGVDPGSKAELVRGFAGARALLGGGFVVEHGARRSRTGQRHWGSGRRPWWCGAHGRVTGWFKGSRAGIVACGRGKGDPRTSRR